MKRPSGEIRVQYEERFVDENRTRRCWAGSDDAVAPMLVASAIGTVARHDVAGAPDAQPYIRMPRERFTALQPLVAIAATYVPTTGEMPHMPSAASVGKTT